MDAINRVAVLGCGTMGCGIAQVCALAGHDVVILEVNKERAAAGFEQLAGSMNAAVDRGRCSIAMRDDMLNRLHPTISVDDLSESDLVIEAVVENLEVKKEILRAVANVVSPEAIVTTNTSALSVTRLAAIMPNPQRFAGLHFFNPATAMKLVEVVRALQTEESVITALISFVQRVGKVAVEVGDSPGFIVNRLLLPYLNDVIQAFDEGLASAADIDTALELGLGYRVGPLSLLDLIGLDVHEHATRNAYDATLDQAFAPPPLLTRMVSAGRLGNKTGVGFRTQKEEA